MTKKSTIIYNQQGIISTLFHRKSPDSGLKLPKNYELKAIKLTSLALTTFLVTLLAASILAPTQPSEATTQVLVTNQATDSYVSLTTSDTVNLPLLSTVAGAVRTAEDVVTVSSGSSGYQLYLSMTSEENSLIRDGATSTGTDTNTGLPTYASTDLIPAGGGDSILSPATLSDNTWGFAVAAQNSTSGSGSEDVITTGFDESYPAGDDSTAESKFTKVPASSSPALIAKRTTSATEVPTKFYYGVRATTAKPSGLYKNTITYTAISNGSASGLASVSPTKITLTGGEITIATPSTATLESLGTITATVGGEECTNPTASKNDSYVNVTCTAPALAEGTHEVMVTFENAGETYVVAGGLEYYSDGSSDSTQTFQEFTIADCEALEVGTTITLKDNRDSNKYTVAKLADGNCWMTQNLRLGSTSGPITLFWNNSDVDDKFVIEPADVQTSGTDSWSDNYDTKHIYATGDETYGNYYNWYTATAGTGTQSLTSGDATSSICPSSGTLGTNWKLPPNTGNGSYTNLFMTKLGWVSSTKDTDRTHFGGSSSTIAQAPYSFPLSGHYDGGVSKQKSSGVFWSRRALSFGTSFAYDFSFNNLGSFNLQGAGNKYDGSSVRCVLAPLTLQDFTVTACNNLSTAETITLWDNRDWNDYTVAKLGDGNCWITQNLRLGADPSNAAVAKAFTLSSSNSNVSSNFTVDTENIQQKTGADNWSEMYDAKHIYLTGSTTYGNYYNWYTATAGTGTQNGVTSGDATASICPSSGTSSTPWRLPPNSGNGSYYNLFLTKLGWVTNASGTDATNFGTGRTVTQTPYSFPLSGYYLGGNVFGQESYGYFWSRTAENVSNAYSFYFDNSSSFYLQGRYGKYSGNSIRCVLVTSE